jgi:TP901 family phage tail tape measure protein
VAKRTISTRLIIDGEAQYKQAITNINAELRKHESALKLTESQYKTNANSMEALQAKQKALSDLHTIQATKVKELETVYKNGQTAVNAYAQKKEELTRKIESNEAALEKLKNTEGDTTEEQKRLTEETAKLKTELEQTEANLSKAETKTNNWGNAYNKAQIELNKTTDAIKENEKYLDEASKSADGAATSIDKFGKETNKSGEAVESLSAALAAAGIAKAVKEIAEAMTACVEASIEFESAMTGVEKTTDLTDRELEQMANSLKGLSGEIPMAASGLAEIAENAGQLGIQKENIVSFTRTMADLGVATNLSGEQAAQTFAKFANITKMAQADFDRLGSSVVALGNNLATTEADIAAMGLNLSAAGTKAGMTEADILGLAGALSSVGMEAQAGGTALSKAIDQMSLAVETGSDKLDDFAEVAGMSADQFAKAYKDNATSAVVAFIKGLGDVETHGKSATLMLDELGFTERRLSDALSRLAISGDLVSDSIELSNKAWKDNTALTTEAGLRYGTTESRLQLMNNALNRVQITIGDQLNPALNKLIDAGTGVLNWLNDFLESNDALVPTVTAVSVGLGVMAAALAAVNLGVKVLIPAWQTFTAALAAHPIGAVTLGVVALVAALATLVISFDDGKESVGDLNKASREAADSLNGISEEFENAKHAAESSAILAGVYIGRLSELEKQGVKTTDQQREYANLVETLKETVPELNVELDEQTGLLKGGAAAWKENITAMQEALIEEAMLRRNAEATEKWADAVAELRTNQRLRDAQAVKTTKAEKAHEDAVAAVNKHLETRDELLQAEADRLGVSVSVLKSRDTALSDLRIAETEANIAMQDAQSILGDYDDGIAQTNETLAGMNAELAALIPGWTGVTEAQAAYSEAIPDAMDGYLSIEERLEAQNTKLKELAAQHEASWQAAYKSIDGQIGLFETMEIKGGKSIEGLIGSLDSQIAYMDTYAKNIEKAMELGVDKGLVSKLSDGSKESAEILAGIVEGGEEDIKLLNEKLALVEEGKEDFAGTVAEMETEFSKNMDAINAKLDELVTDMNKADEALAAAEQTGDSYATGLRNKVGAAYRAGQAIGDAAMRGYNDKFQKHSPSKVAIRAGEETADSYATGFENRIKHMEDTTSKLAGAANDAYVDTMKTINRNAALNTAGQSAITPLTLIQGGQSTTKTITNSPQYTFNSPKALSMREIRQEMLAAKQREALMGV